MNLCPSYGYFLRSDLLFRQTRGRHFSLNIREEDYTTPLPVTPSLPPTPLFLGGVVKPWWAQGLLNKLRIEVALDYLHVIDPYAPLRPAAPCTPRRIYVPLLSLHTHTLDRPPAPGSREGARDSQEVP